MKNITSSDNNVSPTTSLNDTLKIIYDRRAVRKYKRRAVSKELIEQIIEAGRMAPSAINKQPWRFCVVTKSDDIRLFSKEIYKVALKEFVKAGIRKIIKTTRDILHFSHDTDFLKDDDPVFHGAPVVIFISSPKENEWAPLDVGMCSQNMMLCAKSIGLESCPVGFGKYVEKTEIFPRLGIPPDEQVNLAIVFGYGDETPKIHERLKDNVMYL
jgi:nitroreductase